ncbi:MAG: TlpA disulfide reductase family protein [Pyrinomonadaceae bacterium]
MATVICCFLAVVLPSKAPAQSSGALTKEAGAAVADPAAVVAIGLTDARSAAALYEEASTYTDRKFAEFEQKRVPFSQLLAEQTRQQQRELAATHAASLAARAVLSGTDFYYLGLLRQLAGQGDQAIAPLKRFLAEGIGAAEKDLRRNALLTLASSASTAGRLAEAEEAFAEFARTESGGSVEDLFRLRSALSSAYYKAGQRQRSAAHAAAAFHSLKSASPSQIDDQARRARMLGTTGVFLANLYLELKQEAEAARLMEELLRLGLTLPSAQVYRQALELLYENGHGDYVLKSVDDAARHAEAAPEIEAATWIDAQPTTLASLRGRVVLLDFWATWCGPCRRTMPKLKALHEKYKDKGLVVLGFTQLYGRVAGGVDGLDAAQELAFLKEYKRELRLPYPFAVADNDETDARYGVQAIPTAFLIDRRGRVRFITVGAGEGDYEALTGVIKKLLAEAAP